MTTHHLPTSIDHKLDQIKSSIEEVIEKIDYLHITALFAKDTSDGYELDCSVCAGTIRSGNVCIDISRKVEQHEVVEGKNYVTVIDSDIMAIFCAKCGNQHAQVRTWRQLLCEHLGLTEQGGASNQDATCDLCHCHIPDGWARVTIDLMISQAEKNPTGDHIPIYAEDILVFCPSCGNKMGRDKLNDAVSEILTLQSEISNG